jgi:hypothetical protein
LTAVDRLLHGLLLTLLLTALHGVRLSPAQCAAPFCAPPACRGWKGAPRLGRARGATTPRPSRLDRSRLQVPLAIANIAAVAFVAPPRDRVLVRVTFAAPLLRRSVALRAFGASHRVAIAAPERIRALGRARASEQVPSGGVGRRSSIRRFGAVRARYALECGDARTEVDRRGYRLEPGTVRVGLSAERSNK